jgi:hypothetical protein
MQLTKHFTLAELTQTNTGIDNTPGYKEKANLKNLAEDILEPIREAWGAIKVNCAYRSPDVNSAVGGVSTSQHVTGDAADIKPLEVKIELVFDWIVKNLKFGQCILEDSNGTKWIHVSNPWEKDSANQEALMAILVDGKMRYRLYEV